MNLKKTAAAALTIAAICAASCEKKNTPLPAKNANTVDYGRNIAPDTTANTIDYSRPNYIKNNDSLDYTRH